MSEVKLISRKYADKIVEDLLKKYPKGPKGRLCKDNYSIEENWAWRRRSYVKTVVINESTPEWRCHESKRQSFGYGDEILSMVLYHMNKTGGIRCYLRSIDKDCGEAAITRRYNRIDKRIGGAHKRFTGSDEGRGVYRVRTSSEINVYVISNSLSTAKFLGQTMLASSGIGGDVDSYYVSKIAVASPEILKEYNEHSYKSTLRRVSQLSQQIERKKERIISLNHLAQSLADFGTMQSDQLQESK